MRSPLFSSVKSLLMVSFLCPFLLVVVFGGLFLSQAFDRAAQADKQNQINRIISSSQTLDVALGKLLFSGLRRDELAMGQPDASRNSDAMLDFIDAYKQFLANLSNNERVIPFVLRELDESIIELKLLDRRIVSGQPVEVSAWYEATEVMAAQLGNFRTSLTTPLESDQLAWYLQLTLRNYIDQLEKSIWEEAVLLDQVIKKGELSDVDVASMTVTRKISDRYRQQMRNLRTQLLEMDVGLQAMLDPIDQALALTEQALFQFDEIRRGIYLQTMLGEAQPVADGWETTLAKTLEALDKAEALSGEPILDVIKTNQNTTRFQLAVGSVIGLGLLILLLGVFVVLRNRLLTPINRVTQSMSQLAEGDVDVQLPIHGPVDEIGTMIKAISVFKSNALTIVNQGEELKLATRKAQESEQMKSEFLASMSHEIRTPMNGVLGMLSLLERTQLDSDQQHFARTATSSAQLLLGLINDILDFSKIEAGKLDIEEIEFDLLELLESATDLMGLQAESQGNQLILDIHQLSHQKVKGDPLRIQQIINNLLSNAVKFTRDGSVTITASMDPIENESNQYLCQVSLRDTGIGIPQDKIGKLFSAFTQVDALTTRQFGGTGLGLAIVKKLCELMGGDVTVTSEEGVGSEFICGFVLEGVERVQADRTLQRLYGRRVMLLEINEPLRSVLETQLMSWGMHVFLPNRDSVQVDYFIANSDTVGRQGSEWWAPYAVYMRPSTTSILMIQSLGESAQQAQVDAYYGCPVRYVTAPVLPSHLLQALILLEQGEAVEPVKSPIQASINEVNDTQRSIRATEKTTKILLVEDNLINQELVLTFLKNVEIEIDVADNGDVALSMLRQDKQYGLILMDCQMPVLDGYAATRHIRKDVELVHYHTVPIIALTANAMAGDREKCFEAGMSDYISKPVDSDKLLKVIQQWWGKQDE